MATRTVTSHPLPRLYLATPPLAETTTPAEDLAALVSKFDIAAILARPAPDDERGIVKRVKALAPVQKAGAALLIEGHHRLVARAGADGAHLAGIGTMGEALPALKPDRILGVGALRTRHDAMVAGEAGADYVTFGEPAADGERPTAAAIAERLQWWAELFEVPCVGYALTTEEAELFTGSGADFILVADAVWSDPRGAAAALTDLTAAIGRAHARAFGPAGAMQD